MNRPTSNVPSASSSLAPAVTECRHCAQPLAGGNTGEFCCSGCEAAYSLLSEASLTRFYELRPGPGIPQADVEGRRFDHKWLELVESERSAANDDYRLKLDVQGIHCAACTWLMTSLFERHAADAPSSIHINPARGEIELTLAPAFPLDRWVDEVESLGYGLAPAGEERPRASDALLIRLGICLALAANTMMFAIAIYLGLRSGPIYELLNVLSYAAGVVSVAVGGSVFVGSALGALRQRVLHLDVPIALGIVLAFAGASWSFFSTQGHAAYIDTLTVFIALMLVGRWLQQRMLERNRAVLLRDDGAEGLLTRRVSGEQVDIVSCEEVRVGDTLLIAAGELVPVDARLGDSPATCSLDWIDGESRPREFEPGARVPAGAFNVGGRAIQVEAIDDFSSSSLVRWLQRDLAETNDGPIATRWWSRLSKIYVGAVVGLATVGIGAWWLSTGDFSRSMEIGTAILIVTCPCAFGIAAPLAYELVLTQLRRAGVFVRAGDFLDRVRSVTRIAFDKTGTLTTGNLDVVNADALAELSEQDAVRLYNLVVRSSHPKSAAVRRALQRLGIRDVLELDVTEATGSGLEATHLGETLRVGAPGWAGPSDDRDADLVYSVNGVVRLALKTDEQPRPQATDELGRLRAAGYTLAILSGDATPRVERIGRPLGFATEDCLGDQSPDDKARFVNAHAPNETLFVGDGLNDHAAMRAALCSGTPAVTRPFTAARCDFFFASPGLHPIAQVLRSSARLATVVRHVLVFAVIYNVIAVSLALAGLMQPWLAAVLMPVSSLCTIGYAITALSKGADA